MEVHDIYNILLHILFLFCILTALFWFIISKTMENETTLQLTKGVNATVDNITSGITSSTDPAYSVACTYINIHAPAIANGIQTNLKNLSKATNDRAIHNKKLKHLNIIIVIVLIVLTICTGIWLEIHNSNAGKNSPDGIKPVSNQYHSWWRIILINFVLFIGVGICEGIFFFFIAKNYTPVNSTAVTQSVIGAIIEQANAPQSGSSTSTKKK